jgi:hypothetical protein
MSWITGVSWRTILWIDWMNFKSCRAMAGANLRVAIQSACGYQHSALFQAPYLGDMACLCAVPNQVAAHNRTQRLLANQNSELCRLSSVCEACGGAAVACGRTPRTSRMTVVRTCAPRVKLHLDHVDQLGRRGSRIEGRCCFAQTDHMRSAVLALLATAHVRIGQPQQ